VKILLAPAETKNEGGTEKFLSEDNFKFKSLYCVQKPIIDVYEEYIKHLDEEQLSLWFGLKNKKEVQKYRQSLYTQPTMKAIQRYNGVAYDAINYTELPLKAQEYIDNNVIIFSNLFGVVSALDSIPNYKYKQGSKLPNIEVEKYYNQHLTPFLEEHLDDEILDLRAGFYEKFYKPKSAKVISVKFLKEGKVVSHWAKHYRGKLLRELALQNIQNFSEFMAMELNDLKLIEMQEKKNVKLLVMEIV